MESRIDDPEIEQASIAILMGNKKEKASICRKYDRKTKQNIFKNLETNQVIGGK